ncbi:basal-body rod modification protein FlgD [Tateyamaria omphalii]|uniref:flagellar hook capping FlgD N-terminal domain-containing protein n=1 Tax=Tateyamaria omphalii TaxID=299262 RepID=UPI0016728EC7|nr:flagellar hook capping FlgD N-terminal domain-containing protein [Tateyamaria omphalii]GGX38493.1 basal-body rod modification protein FlgD [Tateyamaria omphalii]
MDVTQTTGQAQVANTSTPNVDSSGVLSSDFEVFLKMLTAQAKYQDPLEPLDSSEYAAQLAQFSMVEQQVMTNDLVKEMIAALGANDISGAANWIGMEALVHGPVKFDGEAITIAPNPPVAADSVTLVIKDEQGNEVARRSMPVSAEAYVWDGLDADGTALPHGEYSFQIESAAKGEVLLTESALTYNRVTEARIDSGSTLLVLESGYMVRANDVSGLREAS